MKGNILRRFALPLVVAGMLVVVGACGEDETTVTTTTTTTTTTQNPTQATTPPVTTTSEPTQTTTPPVTQTTTTTPAATVEQLQGVVKSVAAGSLVLSLDDGTELEVEIEQADLAEQMLGKEVEIEVRKTGTERELVEISARGEDLHFTGEVQAMETGAWTIGGTSVKVTANTQLDTGLAAGVIATVEAIKLADGSLLATKIETAASEDTKFTGTVESIAADTWMIGGKTFKVDASTILDQGLAVGVQATVEFVTNPDGTMLAIEIETPAGDDAGFSGAVEAISADMWTIGGRTFKVSGTTLLDQGLAVGVTARVEFSTLADGTMVATSIETDMPDDAEFTGVIESMGPDAWVIGGKTFKVDALTILDEGLAVGIRARVEATAQADGSFLAKEIETDQPGDFKFTGTVESIGPDAWVIGGNTFNVNAMTILDMGLTVGVTATVEFNIQPEGTLLASEIETPAPDDIAGDIHHTGMVQSMGADSWVVGNRVFMTNTATLIDQGLAVGVMARVEFTVQTDGTLLATSIETAPATM